MYALQVVLRNKVSILVLIEFIFNFDEAIDRSIYYEVSILVLIEFIFNKMFKNDEECIKWESLNPCFDRIYFQSFTFSITETGVISSQSLF